MARYFPLIQDEAEFLALVNALPQPITEEARAEYNRLRALGRRRGFAWPYRSYVVPARRANPIATNRNGYTEADRLPPKQRPVIDNRAPEERQYEEIQANVAQETRGLIETIGYWEYFTKDGALYRGHKAVALDADGYRDQAERCVPMAFAEAILQLAREDRYFGPE